MEKKPLALNVDVASVNKGIHRGLGVKIKEDVPWLMLVHSFNHCLELAINDTVSAIFFDEIEVMLNSYASSRNLETYLKKLCKSHQNQQGHVRFHTKSGQ